jgi:hypothetical protein
VRSRTTDDNGLAATGILVSFPTIGGTALTLLYCGLLTAVRRREHRA